MKAITLIRTRQGCSMMEVEPRYDVMLFDRKVGQLYFNMRGYVGTLPTPEGRSLTIGERGISAYQKEAARLNREWSKQTASTP